MSVLKAVVQSEYLSLYAQGARGFKFSPKIDRKIFAPVPRPPMISKFRPCYCSYTSPRYVMPQKPNSHILRYLQAGGDRGVPENYENLFKYLSLRTLRARVDFMYPP